MLSFDTTPVTPVASGRVPLDALRDSLALSSERIRHEHEQVSDWDSARLLTPAQLEEAMKIVGASEGSLGGERQRREVLAMMQAEAESTALENLLTNRRLQRMHTLRGSRR